MKTSKYFSCPDLRVEQTEDYTRIINSEGEILKEWTLKDVVDMNKRSQRDNYVKLVEKDPKLAMLKLGYREYKKDMKVFYLPKHVLKPILTDSIFRIKFITNDKADIVNVKDPKIVYRSVNLTELEPFN